MYKIYRYVAPENQPATPSYHPGSIIFPDQLTQHLPKVQNIILGERRRSVYYDRFTDGEYTEPIVKIDYAFKRHKNGLAYSKIRTVSWMLESDRYSSDVQTDFIPINESQSLAEIKRRRYNITIELKGLAKKFGLEDRTLEIFEKYQLLVNSYIDAGSSRLRNAIGSDSANWLDERNSTTNNTPREVFQKYFSIGTTA